MIRFMREHSDIGQLMPKVTDSDGRVQYLCKLIPAPADLFARRFATASLRVLLRGWMERYELRFTGYNRVMDVPQLSGCFMLFRVAALREIGLFDERFMMYLEDFDICRRMNARFRTVFFPGAAVVHDHARASYTSFRLSTYARGKFDQVLQQVGLVPRCCAIQNKPRNLAGD